MTITFTLEERNVKGTWNKSNLNVTGIYVYVPLGRESGRGCGERSGDGSEGD